jgi:hypothetical protein
MFTGLVLASLTFCGGEKPEAAGPSYEFDTVQENGVVAAEEKGRTVFVVTNPSGIGRAGLKLKAGPWPANVTLRFQRRGGKGGGFTNLEHIEITTERIHCVGSLMLSGRFDFGFLDEKGRKPGETLGPGWAAGRLRVRVEERDGAIEVTLPPRLLAGSSRLEVSWIDAYRR